MFIYGTADGVDLGHSRSKERATLAEFRFVVLEPGFHQVDCVVEFFTDIREPVESIFQRIDRVGIDRTFSRKSFQESFLIGGVRGVIPIDISPRSPDVCNVIWSVL